MEINMSLWQRYEKAIDWISEILGKIGWVLILYCTFFGIADVFLRYVMNSPSLWITSTVQAALVLMACVGGVYALNADAFVKLDLFYANFSPKVKAICDISTASLTFLYLSVLFYKGFQAAKMSIKLKQVTPDAIPIPIYPIKTLIPITAILVMLVVIKKLGNDIKTLRTTGKQLPKP
ncbi:MAG: TRAP transporter small permease subunit [Desulfocapsaceae bacterium]|jgi:TRAP-type mannitol/chloroaromatic compound transport system permease small subunit